MKKSILLSIIVTMVTIVSISSCSNGDDKAKDTSTEIAKGDYYCPMKCEGEKTYAEKGNCPKCGMDLIKE